MVKSKMKSVKMVWPVALLLPVLIWGFQGWNGQSNWSENQSGQLRLVANLEPALKETSGLLYWNGYLLTHNDQGGKPELFVMDTMGKLINTIELPNTENKDWEDLAQSQTHLFIGDFGNNDGDRTDLRILKIEKRSLNISGKQSHKPNVETIHFSYPGQRNFEKGKDHNFDCEAFICFNNDLYLFTKNRATQTTTLYQLPVIAGNHVAKRVQEVATKGRVTSADISADGQHLAITLYNKKGSCYLWQFQELKAPYFLGSNGYLTDLGPFSEVGQLEGVAYSKDGVLYLSAEKVKSHPARLYGFGPK